MEGCRSTPTLVLLAVVILATGGGCAMMPPGAALPPLPVVLPPNANLQQVIDAVNANSGRIHSFSTNQAELSGPAFPVTLRGVNIAFERPRRLRIRAGTSITGTELDLGSNDDLFWIWVRRNEPPAVYYCRHDDFATCAARQLLPLEPALLIEAFGVAGFDSADQHRGPFPRPQGRLEIHSIRQTPCGPAAKITVVDAATAVVLQQHVYDHQGRLIASFRASDHRRDPASGLTMPRLVELQCPQAEFSLRVNLGNVAINQPFANPAELWAMPVVGGTPVVNLADPNLRRAPPPAQGPPPARPPAVSMRPGPRRGWNRLPH